MVPWVAEVTGALAPTYRFTADGFVLGSAVVDMTAVPVIVGLVTYSIGSIAFAAVISWNHARTQRAADQQLQLQAWRLRQLVPEPKA